MSGKKTCMEKSNPFNFLYFLVLAFSWTAFFQAASISQDLFGVTSFYTGLVLMVYLTFQVSTHHQFGNMASLFE